jgi:hypothetical protein
MKERNVCDHVQNVRVNIECVGGYVYKTQDKTQMSVVWFEIDHDLFILLVWYTGDTLDPKDDWVVTEGEVANRQAL